MSVWAKYPIIETNKVDETIDEKIFDLIISLLLLLQNEAKINDKENIIKNNK